MRRFAKPLSGVTCFEGSNPSLSARYPAGVPSSASRAPVAQRIERQVADLKVVGSSPAGRANFSSKRHPSLHGLNILPPNPVARTGSVRTSEIPPSDVGVSFMTTGPLSRILPWGTSA